MCTPFIIYKEIKNKLRNNLNVQHIAKSIIKNYDELKVVVDIFSCIERNRFDDRAESLWFFCKEYVRFLIDSELKKIGGNFIYRENAQPFTEEIIRTVFNIKGNVMA